MSSAPVIIQLTPVQAAAMVHIGARLDLALLFPDGRRRTAARHAFDRIEDARNAVGLDRLDVDLDWLGQVLGQVRRPDFAEVMSARLRDILAVAILWTALEGLDGCSDAIDLLSVDAVDTTDWRAEVIDLLDARRVVITLPGESDADRS